MPVVDRPRIKRTLTPDLAPTGLWEGELACELASSPARLWIGVPTSVDPSGRKQLNTADHVGLYLPIAGGTLAAPGNLAAPGTISAGILSSNGNTNVGWDVTVNAGVLIANPSGSAGASGWHVFVGASDGWCEGPAHLRFGNSHSTGNHSINGSLFVGGLQVYNSTGWLYIVNGVHCDTLHSRSGVYADGNISGHDVTARSGLYVGGNLVTDGGGWFFCHSSISGHDIQARNNGSVGGSMSIGGIGLWNDGAGRLWCGEYNCSNLHASNVFVGGVQLYNDGSGRLGVGNINVGNDTHTPNLYVGGVHCWNNGGMFYASQVRAWTFFSDSHIHSQGTINASGVITGAGVASLVDMDCGNNMTVTVSLTVVHGNLVVANGTGLKPGGGEWAAYSDRRLKASEVPYERGLEAICALRPVTFEYNGEAGTPTDRSFVGVTADDVVDIMPEMIGRHEDYLTVEGGTVKWALVNAVQELAAQVKRLDAELQSLRGGTPHGTHAAAQGHQGQSRQRSRTE